MKLIHFLTTAMLISVFLLGCINNTQTAMQPPESVSTLTASPVVGIDGQQDSLAIYQAVIMKVLLSQDSYFQETKNPTIFIIQYTNDAAGNPQLLNSKTEYISENFQDSISSELSDLKFKAIWVDNKEQVITNPETGRVKDNGIIITVGNINFENTNKVLVPASYYIAPFGAGGRIYIIEKIDGVWTVTGDTGSTWTS